MAQTKRKRSRKHRGTPAGTIERPGRTGRPTGTRKDAKQISRQQRAARLDRAPTWRGSVNRAAIAALVFGAILVIAFGRPLEQAVPLFFFMFVLYIPLGYLTDKAVHDFRKRKRARG